MRARLAACAAALLASCTLENIHDPQFGLLSGQLVLPGLLKSIRCELITFYVANGARKAELDRERKWLREHHHKYIDLADVLALRYFDLDTDAYGAFVLESKVIDNLGLPGTSTSFANLVHSRALHSETFTVSPTLSAQGTYDMNYNFAIRQDSDLSDVAKVITEDQVPAFSEDGAATDNPLRCYHAVVAGRYDDLARGKYPTLEGFQRLVVDGGLPLASWLQENTTIMGVSRNILADASAPKDGRVPVALQYLSEGVDGGQMSYIFTVQYTGGVDAKFSLLSTRWNTLAADFMASTVQTGVLSLYVNGFMAATALGAKGGIVVIADKAPPAQPQNVFVVNGYPKQDNKPPNWPPVRIAPMPENLLEEKEAPPPPSAPPAPSNRGRFLYPGTPFLLTPGP